MADRTDAGRWYIWQVDSEGKMIHWVGMIRDPGAAFGWFRDMDLDPSQYRVNNVPPATGMTPNPEREVFALSPTDIREGAPLPVRTFDDRPGVTARKTVKKRTPARRGQRPAKKVADTPETLRMKQEAKQLLEQHKADEAAEMKGSE